MVTATVPPEAVILLLIRFFNCTVIVEVVTPSASIEEDDAEIVDLETSTGSTVNATGTVAVAVVPLIVNPTVAVPDTMPLVKVAV